MLKSLGSVNDRVVIHLQITLLTSVFVPTLQKKDVSFSHDFEIW